jgi:hypothetical protein
MSLIVLAIRPGFTGSPTRYSRGKMDVFSLQQREKKTSGSWSTRPHGACAIDSLLCSRKATPVYVRLR